MTGPFDPATGEVPIVDDGKAPDALRTIGEVARALDIRQHVLRYWEEQFPMLRPLTRAGGRRYYRPGDIALIRRIDSLLNREGYTIKGARQLLRGETASSGTVQPDAGVSSGGVQNPAVAASALVPVAQTLRGVRDRLAAAIGE